MKIAILDIHYVADEVALRDIDSTTLSHGDKKLLGDFTYHYFENAKDKGIKPDDLDVSDLGRWVRSASIAEVCFIVEDNYDFNANSATDLTDTDEKIILNFHKYGPTLLGTASGFKDWMALRDHIKTGVENIAGNDYSTYANVSSEGKAIAAIYVPTKIFDNIGIGQLVADSGGGAQASENLKHYMDCAEKARHVRYVELSNYVFQTLGKADAMKAEDDVLNEKLVYKFTVRGRKRRSEDGLDGIIDWIEAGESYLATGLKQQIVDAVLTIKNGTDLTEFIDTCIAIVEKGVY